MTIVNPLAYTIQNGQAVDAVPVMANLNQIVNNVNANAAPVSGSAAQTFAVANATATNQAVNLGQTGNLYAPIAGNSGQTFAVANASTSSQAVNLGQTDGRYQQRNIIVEAGAIGTLSTNAFIGAYVNAMQVNGSGVPVTLPGNCSGSYAVATAAATNSQTINILKMPAGSTTLNTIGTITYAAGAARLLRTSVHAATANLHAHCCIPASNSSSGELYQ